MARSLSQTLTLSCLSPLLHPSSRLFNHHRCSYSTDPPPPASYPETSSETELPAGLCLLEDVIYTLIAKVLSSKMVLHKGQGTAPQLRQSWITASEVLAAFGMDPSQNVRLRAAREDLRPGSSTAVSQAPPPARTQAPSPAPAREGIGSSISDAVTWGTVNALTQRAVDAVLGPRTVRCETVGAQAPGAVESPCSSQSKSFIDCLDTNRTDIGRCQFYFDMLTECSSNSGSNLSI